jgi:hypothetical protein
VEKPTGLAEETLAHFEHTPEFMTTCLIVNEPSHFLQILAIVFDLSNRFFELAKSVRSEFDPLPRAWKLEPVVSKDVPRRDIGGPSTRRRCGAQNRPRVSLAHPSLSSVVPSGQYFLEGN